MMKGRRMENNDDYLDNRVYSDCVTSFKTLGGGSDFTVAHLVSIVHTNAKVPIPHPLSIHYRVDTLARILTHVRTRTAEAGKRTRTRSSLDPSFQPQFA